VVRHPEAMIVICAFLIYYWHTCAWISLVVRRGAFAAAIGIAIITWVALTMGFALLAGIMGSSSLDGDVFVALTTIGFLAASGFMHVGVVRRLRAKAAG
jgi:hypothetical protein